MSEVWLTSDEHYYHNNIIEFCKRPFKDMDEMIQAFIKNHNDRVSHGDRTYHMGDFSFAKKKQIDKLKEVFSALNGQHYLISGNHDSDVVYEMPWVWTRQKSTLKCHGSLIHLDHYPHLSWNRSYHLHPHACGHVHSNGTFWFAGKSCDVGVDYWNYSPVNSSEFIKWVTDISVTAAHKNIGYYLWRGKPGKDVEYLEIPT